MAITGIQMELGSVATPFERRPHGTELALCQRYYFRINPRIGTGDMATGWNATTTTTRTAFYFPVTMRTAPTALEQSGTATDYSVRYLATFRACGAVPIFYEATTNSGFVELTTDLDVLTAGQGSNLRPVNTSAFLAWSAEL